MDPTILSKRNASDPQGDHEVDAEVLALIERGVQKGRVSDRVIGLLATFVIALSVGGMALLVSLSTGKDLVKSERAQCYRLIEDRLGTIELREAQTAAASKIAADPFQSPKTRDGRRAEAKALQKSVDDLRVRVDVANGGTLDCVREFPDPGLFR